MKNTIIEQGKSYRNHARQKIGPMEPNPFDHDGSYPWTAKGHPYTYTDEGVWMNGRASEHDLVLGKGQ